MLRALRQPGWVQGLQAAQGWRAAWTWAALLVLALRLGLGLLTGLAWSAARPYMPAAIIDNLESLAPASGLAPALEAWPRWDAMHYLAIAQRGYFGVSEGDTVFYPLYPALVALGAALLGGNVVLAALVVSTAAAVAALACLYHLAEARYGAQAAQLAVLALALYPTAFFLLAPFTESLFLALTLAAFVAGEARRWWLAGLLGALASLTRGPGLLTAPALAWLAWEQMRAAAARPGIRTRVPMGVALALPLAGGGAFLAWRAWAGFAPMGDVLRAYSGLEMVDPLRGLVYALRQFWAVHDLHTFLDVGSAGLFLGLAAAMLRRPGWRAWPWVIYTCANLGFFLSKHSLNASSLQSLARYVLVLFPAFMVLGDWLAGQTQRVRFAYLLASSLGQVVLSALYAVGWFIG